MGIYLCLDCMYIVQLLQNNEVLLRYLNILLFVHSSEILSSKMMKTKYFFKMKSIQILVIE